MDSFERADQVAPLVWPHHLLLMYCIAFCVLTGERKGTFGGGTVIALNIGFSVQKSALPITMKMRKLADELPAGGNGHACIYKFCLLPTTPPIDISAAPIHMPTSNTGYVAMCYPELESKAVEK